MPATESVHQAEARAWYDRALARGTDRFLEPSRDNCPWCGSADLRHHLTSPDVRQAKPGTFRLDRCTACGHIFQNPQLSPEGLEFYYRDAYDGVHADEADANFSTLVPFYRSRAETVRDLRPDAPRRWLDVGTGNGQFCRTARDVFPDTVFDGLDLSEGVLAGKERGWLDAGYHGNLLDRVDDLAGRYDQISMFHYLEHTREPLLELDAIAKILAPDGWLLIEQPDPECRMARLYRSGWAGWLQPEHLHMVTVGNLTAALEQRGFEVVAVQHEEAHMPLETFLLATTLLRRIGPDPDLPWRTVRSRTWARVRRLLGMALVAPLVLLAPALDKFVIPRLLRSSHAYRVLARRR
jgi:SAM-dependent methyltransferase